MRGTFQLMKSVNKTTILNKIRLSESISRADIAKETGITAPTVSNIVSELIDEKLVKETKLGKSNGGRKPTLLQLNEKGYYVIGIDAGTRMVRGVVCDLLGNFLVRSEIEVSDEVTNDLYLQTIIEVIDELLKYEEFNSNNMIGIGVAMHGVMNIEEGIAYYSANTGLHNIRVKEVLEEKFGLPVTLENNSRALTLGEFWFGDYGEINRFSAINVGLGVGSGLIINHKLVHGSQNIAGEIGHSTISLEGPRCTCGNIGCLETFVSGKAIERRAKEEIEDAPHDITAKDVYDLAITSHEEYKKILEDTAYYLAVGINNFINTVNPEVVVLSGGVMGSSVIMLPIIKKHLKERTLIKETWKETTLIVSDLCDNATLLGAAALQLQPIFVY